MPPSYCKLLSLFQYLNCVGGHFHCWFSSWWGVSKCSLHMCLCNNNLCLLDTGIVAFDWFMTYFSFLPIIEKLYNSHGPELRRSLFSLKQLFQVRSWNIHTKCFKERKMICEWDTLGLWDVADIESQNRANKVYSLIEWTV